MRRNNQEAHMHRLIIIFALILTLGAGVAFAAPTPGLRSFNKSVTLASGQVATVTVLNASQHKQSVNHVFNVAFQDLQEVAKLYATNNPRGDLVRMNTQAARQPVLVQPTTLEFLRLAKKVERMTKGSVSIVEGGTMKDIQIDKRKSTVQFLKSGMQLRMHQVMDGFLADRLMASVWNANIDNAMVEVGRASRSVGHGAVGPWRRTVSEVDGRYAKQGMAISFSDASTATVAGGRGKKASNVRSATVIAPDAAVADAVANAISQMSATEGLKMANRLPSVHALVRDGTGKLHRSKGL
jgi:thiamine biosynthesis lipoprotein ApbE